MEIRILAPGQAGVILARIIGCEPDSVEGIAELLRHEVSARGHCLRHFAIERVCRLAAPAAALEPARVAQVCEELERQGDLLAGERGNLHPAPLRVISLGDSIHRFVCALSGISLIEAIPGEWNRRGVLRDCRTMADLSTAVAELRGVIVTSSVWAGLDRSPPADEPFIKGLDSRLVAAPRPAGSLDHPQPLAWSAWGSKTSEASASKLWRARSRWGRWTRTWTAGGSPSEQSFVELHRDEGPRAWFALARTSGQPASAPFERRGEAVMLDVPGWLPLPEYRYLSTHAFRASPTGSGSNWSLPASRFDAVTRTLADRLGLSFEEKPSE